MFSLKPIKPQTTCILIWCGPIGNEMKVLLGLVKYLLYVGLQDSNTESKEYQCNTSEMKTNNTAEGKATHSEGEKAQKLLWHEKRQTIRKETKRKSVDESISTRM